jgi:hypothetical protein
MQLARPMPMQTEIPEDLWRDIKLLQDRLTTFWRDAQGAANDQEYQTGGPPDFDYYRWLNLLLRRSMLWRVSTNMVQTEQRSFCSRFCVE